MTDDLVKRLLDVASRLADEAAGTIHRLTAERDRAIDDARDNAEYVDLVSQYRAERDAAKADNARLRVIGSEMAESIEGNYYLPGVATRWRAALTGKETK